ncbi:hypothetical protein EVAR_53680_1 [Eumeta japonica]|uniref:Uncharacterized protein n=1 Tax=Eumeta variegata TaxID=151549 RepID=A0A4C1YRR5_EUMVA|nr:hypothetical protein EVAR_53680_1 [Eumeta japonica]
MGTANGIGIESGTENKIENETGVESECRIGIRTKSATGIVIKTVSEPELEVRMKLELTARSSVSKMRDHRRSCWRKARCTYCLLHSNRLTNNKDIAILKLVLRARYDTHHRAKSSTGYFMNMRCSN